ncbi:hypothetical protein BH11PSE3_BH11PSE3_36890 [soil metagenome]
MFDSSFLHICAVAFVAMVAGALTGICAARALPGHHLSPESSTVVKLAAAVVVSLTAMVLALMLSAANSSYSVNAGIVKKLGADFVHLDHMLRAYGPEANDARAKLRAYASKKEEELFPTSQGPSTDDRQTADLLDVLLESVVALSAIERRHNALGAQALTITSNIYAERWLLWANPGTTVPLQFLYVLIFWLFLIFVSFGVFAPVNATVVTSFFLSALAVTGAILIILELGDPMRHGWIQISSDPMRRALLEIERP